MIVIINFNVSYLLIDHLKIMQNQFHESAITILSLFLVITQFVW